MYDIILKDCRLFNGESFDNETKDIALLNGRIAEIGKIDAKSKKTVNCSNMTVTPGLIDFHTHLFPLTALGINPSLACLPFGVTAAADAGSAGCNTFECSLQSIRNMPIALKCFLNVCSSGLFSMRTNPEDIDPEKFDVAVIERLFAKYPDVLIGLKIRMGKESSRHYGKAPLEKAAELAKSLGVPLCVHVSDPAFPAGELAEILSAGDIMTHTYQGRGNTVLTADNAIDPRILAARERGVIFDVGDACIHFDLEVFKRCAELGFLPDTVGSDVTDSGVFDSGSFALPLVLSKLITLGMAEDKVLKAATSRAADLLGFDSGRIAVGKPADIAVFEIKHNAGIYHDRGSHTVNADYLLVPRMTVQNGSIVWRDIEFR